MNGNVNRIQGYRDLKLNNFLNRGFNFDVL